MDASFWLERWKNNEIGFHKAEVNALLERHFNKLHLASGSRILVPLCGKSYDLTWLAEQGFEVIGVELSELAIESYFAEREIKPTIAPCGKLQRYKAGNIELLLGDIFDLSAGDLGRIDAIYDRAALVALPEPTRLRYTKHLIDITNHANQLLITFDYDQSLMQGPPFSISAAELEQHYAAYYNIEAQETRTEEGKLKGHTATETLWTLGHL